MALAKEVPDADGKLVANPYKMWNEIDPSLPAEKIEVLGPPPTSGTRDSFVELVMEKGAEVRLARRISRSPMPRPLTRYGNRSAKMAPMSKPARTTI